MCDWKHELAAVAKLCFKSWVALQRAPTLRSAPGADSSGNLAPPSIDILFAAVEKEGEER